MDIIDQIDKRMTGQYPLSIATSLAIESLFNIHPEEQHNKPPIFDYKSFWINIRTLIRNIIGSLDADNRKRITPMEVKEALEQEIVFLESEMSQNNISCVFYVSEMDLSKYKHAKIRGANTPKQIIEADVVAKTIALTIKSLNQSEVKKILVFKSKLDPGKADSDTLILTHIPLDLIAWKRFRKLVLIESHTGKLKERNLWYTKYYNGQELSRLPFTEKLLQIFGDKEVFSPLGRDIRNTILEVAEKYNWTPTTTEDKINYTLSTLKNRYFYDWYLNL